jgi:N utilization substance protein B
MTSMAIEAKHPARAAARLAAVQALYQMETAGAGVDAVVREFLAHRLDGDIEGETLHVADARLFEDIVRGVVEGQRRIDRAVSARLADNWKLERIDSTARGILRAAVYEIGMRADIPFRVIIDEYVELARDFFGDGAEPAFINGVLDSVARAARGEEAGGS